MKTRGILFFADRLPPQMGGVEMHGAHFIEYFKDHPTFPILKIIKKEKEHLPTHLNPSFLFFNSGRWIEQMEGIRKTFPHASFIYRTGGNEILKAPLVHKKTPDHGDRQKYWAKTLNQSLDLLITNSDYTEKRLESIGVTVPFARCVGGVSVYPARKKEGSSVTFFCAARFVSYKNHLLLIRVFQELKKRGHSLTLRLAGDGPLFQKAKESALQDPSILFLGPLNNDKVSREMAHADIYIQLSDDQKIAVPGGSYTHSEGMGRSILEAISAGKFVIAGKSGALHEIVTPERGILVPLNSMEKIVGDIERLILNPSPQHPPTDHYSWENLFKTYESLYENVSRYRKV